MLFHFPSKWKLFSATTYLTSPVFTAKIEWINVENRLNKSEHPRLYRNIFGRVSLVVREPQFRSSSRSKLGG